MIVSMIKCIIELPGISSIKEKRRIVNSLKDRIFHKYKVSISEVDLHDSLSFTQLGVAIVSNSKEFGEKVMNKILLFIEENVPGRLVDSAIMSEAF
jgi:uncharacterized protein YlxP (DUF503 family)